MKENKVLTVLVIVLAAALVIETAYLWNLEKKNTRKCVFAKDRSDGTGKDMPKIRKAFKGQAPRFKQERQAVEPVDLFKEMEQMQSRMDRAFEDSFARPHPRMNVNFGARNRFLDPQMNVQRTDAAYIIQMDVPGMKKEDIAIDVQANMLTVSGQRKYEATQEEKGEKAIGQIKESEFGFFSKTIPLAPDIKKEGIKASCENGVLLITLPRIPVEKSAGEQPVKIKIE